VRCLPTTNPLGVPRFDSAGGLEVTRDMTNYKIMACPSDNSESPRVFERGWTFRPAANDRAFELSGRDDGNDYWATEDDTLEL